jgi:hypothetical protein
MFARVATFEGFDVAAADRMEDEVNARVEPVVCALSGFRGFLNLVDREDAKSLTIAFFDTEEDMRAAEQTFDEELPKLMADLIEEWGGRRTSVDWYEVATDRRETA